MFYSVKRSQWKSRCEAKQRLIGKQIELCYETQIQK